MIILPCPIRPDLDCVAGSIAYAEYLTRVKKQKAMAWVCGTPDDEAQFHLNRCPEGICASDKDAEKAIAYILVDFSVKKALPPTVDPARVVQVIDHRLFTQPDQEFPNALLQLEEVGAAATQITEFFMRDALEPSAHVAAMLYGAIYSHTLCLHSTTTTDRDRAAYEWLAQYVPDADHLVKEQMRARTDAIIRQMPQILVTEMKMETSCLSRYAFTQLELYDGLQFWQDYKKDIIAWTQTNKFPTVVNIIDIGRNTSILFSSSGGYNELLEEKLGVKAIEKMILLKPAMFRKQIIPLLH